jgi:carboxypeptidase family protein/TonB-dependent receptor-like protein
VLFRPTRPSRGLFIFPKQNVLEARVKYLHISSRTTIFVRAASILASLFVGLGALTSLAQSSEINGTIQDGQKAQIQGARISITRTETGERREGISNQDGNYSFAAVAPGHYDVRVEMNGFRPEIKSGVQVLTGQASVVDFSLDLGQVQEQIEVDASGALLQTESSTIQNVIENQTIVDLPLLDRRAGQLQRLNGFVVGNGTGVNSTFAVAGGRGNNANYYIDGGTSVNLIQGVETLVFDLPVDALQEFTLTSSDYTADLGQSGGAVIQMTTKSGTNQFHGSAYLYYRSNNLQAVPDFAARNPSLNYKLFGGSIGGPIIKDKTHFFFTYEGKRQIQSAVLTLSVPTAAELDGDFSGALQALDPSGTYGLKLIDPSTGNPVVGNNLALNASASALNTQLDPYGTKLAAYYPQPNIAGAAANKNNYSANDPTSTTVNDYVARIDHVFREKDTLYARFLGEPGDTVTANVFPTPGTDVYGENTKVYYYSEAGTYTHIFAPSLVNEARVAFTQRESLPISNGVNSPAATALALPGVNPNFFPSAAPSGLSPIGNNSQQERLQTPVLSNEYTDNLSWQHGKHQFKFGGAYRTSTDGDKYYPTAGGLFSFNFNGIVASNAGVTLPSSVTGGLDTIGSLANLLWGRAASATRTETEYLHSKAWTWGFYAQDSWKASPKLTLNLGVRWDLESPRYLDNNHQNSFNTTEMNPVSNTPGVITFAGINGQSKYANNFDDALFGPRLGFAYNPTDRWVIRGGSAILYPGEYDAATPVTAYTGFSNAITLNSPNSAKGVPAVILAQNGTSGTGQAAFPTTAQLTPGYGAVAVGDKPVIAPQFYKPRRINGYLYQANLDIQHELPGNILIDIGYLGSFGHHLVTTDAESINQIDPANAAALAAGTTTAKPQSLRPFPQFSNVQYLGADIGQSNYNGGNIGIQKRYGHGFQYQANYTFSKFIDNQISRNELAAFGETFTDYYNPQDRRGLSGNDVRHRLIGNALYDLPIGKGKLVNVNSTWLNAVVGGWTISGLSEIHSGTALSIFDSLANGTFSDGVRPNISANPFKLSSGRSRSAKEAEWFDTTVFSHAAPYTFGNTPRSFGRGPRLFTSDASLVKKVPVYEGAALELRAEALNVFNHASLGNPNTTFGSSSFGTISTLQPGGVPSRTLQLAAHLTF